MRVSARAAVLVVALGSAVACLAPQENPTFVKDLRVLGMSFEPPELLAERCDLLRSLDADGGVLTNFDAGLLFGPDGGFRPNLDSGVVRDLLALAPLVAPVRFTALIADPDGGGRPLQYALRACANTGDRQCDTLEDTVPLDAGLTMGGSLSVVFQPGTLQVNDGGRALLQEVLEQDRFRGLGGIRLPVVLALDGGPGEMVYAQKLMVLGCKFFPEQRPNVTPVLPGLTLDGQDWPEDLEPELRGKGPFSLAPVDFSALEEDYVVPSFELRPIKLKESWKIAWYTDFGTMSPFETGGTNLAGMTGSLRSRWTPEEGAGPEPRVVTFTAMVRDGRGGQSWLQRRVRWAP